jgi:GTPase SAR1 family protein
MIRCGGCGRDNPGEYKFCLGCGRSLVPTGHFHDPDADLLPATKRRIPSGIVEQLAWEPGGDRLAVLSAHGKRGDLVGRISIDGLDTLRDTDYLSFAWDPKGGRILASTDADIQLLDPASLRFRRRVSSETARRLAWAPSGDVLGCIDSDRNSAHTFFRSLEGARPSGWRAGSSILEQTLFNHPFKNIVLEWSPDGELVAVTTFADRLSVLSVRDLSPRWSATSGDPTNGDHVVTDCAWSPSSRTLAYVQGSTLMVVDLTMACITHAIELHQGRARGLAFSPDGHWLAVLCQSTWRLFETGSWVDVGGLPLGQSSGPEVTRVGYRKLVAFHGNSRRVAVPGSDHRVLVFDLDLDEIARRTSRREPRKPTSYANAKVVLLGDSGVGKSGLALALSGQPFAPTESTHGRHVWSFETSEEALAGGEQEVREVLLWDLAGQPGYRLVHQLHLDEVAVALIVFDAKSEIDPLGGIKHWLRALAQAQRLQSSSSPPTAVWLVAARVDRGGINVSRERIEALARELGARGYLETSAKEGLNVDKLADIIRDAVAWDALPRLRSTDLFSAVRAFVIREKQAGRVLSNANEQLARFLRDEFATGSGERVLRETVAGPDADADVLRRVFLSAVGRLESSGLVRRLTFGNLILLQPEMLDAYASALVNAARAEPDGLGNLHEEAALLGRFAIPADERLSDPQDERLLLIATVEDLLRHEVALKEQADDGPHLVFPSQLTREAPLAAENDDRAAVFEFQGAVLNVYATLVVRLSYSGRFKKRQMWKNGLTFEAIPRGACRLLLRESEEGVGELAISYGADTSAETRSNFESYVWAHLERRVVRGTLRRRVIHRCPECQTAVSEVQAERRRARGFSSMSCPVCDGAVSLAPTEPALGREESAAVVTMDRRADSARDENAASLVVSGKRNVGEFDVFLCHASADKASVKRIAELLKRNEILPWLDEWELRPGMPWQRVLEEQIERIRSAAVFVGPSGLGPWQHEEVEACLRQFVKRGCPVIPVLLADTPAAPKLPVFLEARTWVDFRRADPDPVDRLVWGITGERRATRSS